MARSRSVICAAVVAGCLQGLAWIGGVNVRPCLRSGEPMRDFAVQREAEAKAKSVQSSRGRRTNLDRLKAASERATTGFATPLVNVVKGIMGEDKLVAMRKSWIQQHTKVIGAGVHYMADKNVGRIAMTKLFELADQDKSGQVDREELMSALHKMGFSWITKNKIETIMTNVDKDDNHLIDYEEFLTHCPGALRKNFAKLASARGKWMGLLA